MKRVVSVSLSRFPEEDKDRILDLSSPLERALHVPGCPLREDLRTPGLKCKDGHACVPVPEEIPPGWEGLTADWLSPESVKLREFLRAQREEHGSDILPPAGQELRALLLTPLESVRVVLLGQDPYPHDAADGLAFSVRPGIPLPVSAKRIAEELAADGFGPAPPGLDLTQWAQSGVLLLNATLTVRRGKPASHYHQGWEAFTTAVLRLVRERDEDRWRAYTYKHADWNERKDHPVPAVFLALGAWARSQMDGTTGLIVPGNCLVTVPHPAAREGQFSGSRPFSRVNLRLEGDFRGPPVDWRLRTVRERLYGALQKAWNLPPAEGKKLLSDALDLARSVSYGVLPPVTGNPPSGSPERAGAEESAEVRLLRAAYAKLSDAVSALKDAGRVLK